MLSEYSLRGLKWLTEGGQILRVSLFAWDAPTKTAYVTKSKPTWWIVITIATYLYLQFVFEVVQLYRLAGDPSEPLPDYLQLLLQCSTRVITVGVTIDSCFHGERMACLLNQSLLLNKRMREVAKGRRLEDTMKNICPMALLLAFGYPVIVVAGFLGAQHQSRYWHHYVFPPAIFPFLVPLICVIEYLITTQNMHVTVFYVFNANVYFKTVNEYMQLIVDMKKCPGLEWKNDCLSLFRTMQVYNQNYNDNTAVMWTYGMIGMFVNQVGGIVGGVRFGANVPFPANVMFPVAVLGTMYVTINMYGATYVATGMSEDLAQKYFKSTDKYYRRVGASMRPLYAEVWPFFTMTKTTSFSFTSEVVDKSISILLCT